MVLLITETSGGRCHCSYRMPGDIPIPPHYESVQEALSARWEPISVSHEPEGYPSVLLYVLRKRVQDL